MRDESGGRGISFDIAAVVRKNCLDTAVEHLIALAAEAAPENRKNRR